MKRKIFSVLFALVLVLSFSLVTAVPVGAVEPPPNPTFATVSIPSMTTPSNKITIGWERASDHGLPDIPEVGTPGDAIHVTTSEVTLDFAMVIVPTAFTLDTNTTISYWGYTVEGSDVKALDEIYLFLDGDDVDEEVDTILLSHKTGPQTSERWGEWDQWTLEGVYTEFRNMWHTLPDYTEVTLEGYIDEGYTVLAIALTAGPTTLGVPVNIDVYFDQLTLNGDMLLDEDTGTIVVPLPLGDFPPPSIQDAIDAALPGTTIIVAAGTYDGAKVDRDVTITGAADGASVITSGLHYEGGHLTAQTAFLLDADADGAEIRNFTINCNASADFYFGVFARGADNVIVDSLTINYPVQGISNWGGNSWQITKNVVTSTEASGGGGISIYLGAKPEDGLRTCSNNLVQKNKITGEGATSPDYTCPGICLSLDTRYGGYDNLNGNEELTGNQILGNTITVTNVTGGVGIVVSVIGLDTREKIDAVMAKAPVHDNTVKGNTIDGPWQGMLFRHVSNLTVEENEITNCCGEGIVVEGGHSGVHINHNNIYGNGTDATTVYSGVYNDDAYEGVEPFEVDYGSIDARYNWWGDVAGPENIGAPPYNPYNEWTEGDSVSDNVDYMPWLIQTELREDWNIYSMPITPDEACLEPFMAALTKAMIEGEGAAYYFDSDNQSWGIPEDAGSLDAVYLKMKNPVTVNIWASSEVTFPWQKEMKVGWNFVGLAELYEMDVDKALSDALYGTGVADLVGYNRVKSPSLNGASWTYMRGQEVNIPPMFPTEGYWVFMVNDGVLGGFTSTPIVEVAEPIPGPRS